MTVKLTPDQIADQQRGSTRIAPGIWQDRDGAIHFSITELLAMVQLEDTPAHRAEVERMIRAQLAQYAPGIEIIRQEPDDEGVPP
jgi:hypothetical protein